MTESLDVAAAESGPLTEDRTGVRGLVMSLRRGRTGLVRFVQAHRAELAAVAAVTLVAFFFRTYDLTSLPAGMHGDEAVAGLEAQRIIDEHNIGPYSPPAAGQPAGPLYFFAIAVWLFGHSVMAVRLVPAIIGTLTVPLLYLVVRRSLGIPVAAMSAIFLAIMGWHIHFARVGFPLEAWPFVVLLAVGALVEAVTSGSLRWWAASGGLVAGGIYVYNAHHLFLAVVGLFLIGYLIANRGKPLVEDIASILIFSGVALLVAYPMTSFASDPANGYWEHFNQETITSTPAWKELKTPVGKLHFLSSRYKGYWEQLSFHPRPDGLDATGTTAIVPPAMFGLAALGLFVSLATHRKPLVAIGFLVLVVMPLGSVLTTDGLARRTFAVAPFLAIFAAVSVADGSLLAIQMSRRASRGKRLSQASLAIAGIAVIAVGYQNIHDYFWTFRKADPTHWVYGPEFTESANYIAAHGDGAYVYFLSNRWSFHYEPMRFLAGQARGEDRSREFGEFGLDVDPGKRPIVFMLVGDYRALLPTLEQMYPGGRAEYGSGGKQNSAFIAYHLAQVR